MGKVALTRNDFGILIRNDTLCEEILFRSPPLEEENWKKERAMFLFTYPTIFVRARSSGKRERLLGRRGGKGGGGGRMEGVGGLEKLQTALLGVEEERGWREKEGRVGCCPEG